MHPERPPLVDREIRPVRDPGPNSTPGTRRWRTRRESQAQLEICQRWGAQCLPPEPSHKLGIAENVREGVQPINGLRHPPEGDTSGWYIWAGEELSTSADFFLPLHICHLDDWRPDIIKYLGLPPGWRFLIAPNHEDVWFDESLLDI